MANATFVPDYSGGSAVDLHHLPSWFGSYRTPVIANYSVVNKAGDQPACRRA